MLRQVRSHGLDIDAHHRAELQFWLVHKRFGWAYYVHVYARAKTDCVPSSTNAFTNLFSSTIVLTEQCSFCKRQKQVNDTEVDSSSSTNSLSELFYSRLIHCMLHISSSICCKSSGSYIPSSLFTTVDPFDSWIHLPSGSTQKGH